MESNQPNNLTNHLLMLQCFLCREISSWPIDTFPVKNSLFYRLWNFVLRAVIKDQSWGVLTDTVTDLIWLKECTISPGIPCYCKVMISPATLLDISRWLVTVPLCLFAKFVCGHNMGQINVAVYLKAWCITVDTIVLGCTWFVSISWPLLSNGSVWYSLTAFWQSSQY
jgi:hypothetical protein